MSTETIFRIAFWLLFGGLIVMQVYFATRVRQAGERVGANRRAIEREGWGYITVRIIGSLALIAFLVLYAIHPTWLGVLSVPFPGWLRWLGIVLGCASFVLYAWAQAALGKAWSPHLQKREKHEINNSIRYYYQCDSYDQQGNRNFSLLSNDQECYTDYQHSQPNKRQC